MVQSDLKLVNWLIILSALHWESGKRATHKGSALRAEHVVVTGLYGVPWPNINDKEGHKEGRLCP